MIHMFSLCVQASQYDNYILKNAWHNRYCCQYMHCMNIVCVHFVSTWCFLLLFFKQPIKLVSINFYFQSHITHDCSVLTMLIYSVNTIHIVYVDFVYRRLMHCPRPEYTAKNGMYVRIHTQSKRHDPHNGIVQQETAQKAL